MSLFDQEEQASLAEKEKQARSLIPPAKALYELGEYEECILTCQQAIALDSFIIAPFYYKGLCFIALEGFHEAIQVCRDAIMYMDDFDTDPDPGNERFVRQICFVRGLALLHLKEYKEALKYFDRVQSMQPASVMVWNISIEACNYMGRCYFMLGNYREALKWFEKAHKMDERGNHSDPIFNMGLVYQKIGNLEKALEMVEKAIESRKYNPLYWNAKGLILLEMKQERLAAIAFEKAEEYMLKGRHDVRKSQNKREQTEMEMIAEENRMRLLAMIPRFRLMKFKDQNLIKERDEILKETIQALQDKVNNAQIEAILQRIEELAKKNDMPSQDLIKLQKVEKVDPNEKIQDDINEIKHNERLDNYHKLFSSFFNKIYLGYLGVASGLVPVRDKDPTPISLLTTVGQMVPFFGEIFSFFQQRISKFYHTNEPTRMAQLAKNRTEATRMVENVARALTLAKKQEILTIQEKKKSSYVEFFNIIKSQLDMDTEFNTAEKLLALQDATFLIMACATGQINFNQQLEGIEDEMVNAVIQGRFEQAVLDEFKGGQGNRDLNMRNSVASATSGTAKVSPEVVPTEAASSNIEGEPPKESPKQKKRSWCNIF